MSWLTIRIDDGFESCGAQRSITSARKPLRGQRVDVAERLVHEENLRIDRQRAGDAEALLHSAGELARVRLFEATQAHRVDCALTPPLDLVFRNTSRLQHDFDVLHDGHPRIQRKALKHDGYARREAPNR